MREPRVEEPVTIAVDAMGGDVGVAVCVPATLMVLQQYPLLRAVLVGDSAQVEPLVHRRDPRLRSRIEIRHASEIVGMDEPPLQAVRRKKDSSMRVAIDLVHEGQALACVSAGNTGALMATARFVLDTLPGIDRPAILSVVPAATGQTHMLDLGANTECTAEHLFQFAVMGSVVAADLHGISAPRIGLLNIGVEETKGGDRVRDAARLLAASGLNYVGFVEGNDIFSGVVDVVVSDGFSGNVALKTAEGTASLILKAMRDEFSSGVWARLAGLAALPTLRKIKARLDPRRYNGASLVGLNGIVVKSHGSADQFAFEHAIRVALVEVEKGVPRQISQLLQAQAA